MRSARNAAGSVLDRITAAKARKKNEETIVSLEEIVNDLLADKAELTLIAQALDEQLVAQRLSPEDVAYITENLLPLIERLSGLTGGAPASGELTATAGTLLSKETLTILQLIGFNFRQAIGAPLTERFARYIELQAPTKGGSNQRQRKPKQQLALLSQGLVMQRCRRLQPRFLVGANGRERSRIPNYKAGLEVRISRQRRVRSI